MNATAEKSSAATSGPWVAAAGPSSIVGWPVVAQNGRLICSIATPPKDIKRIGKDVAEYDAFIAECGANARLIAAAPDLLAVLEELVSGVQEWCDAVSRDPSWDGWDHHYKHYAHSGLDKARAALSKASRP